MWWVDHRVTGHQVPTQAALSLPLLNSTGERKYNERFIGQDKDREKSLTSYRHRQNRLNIRLKISFIYYQSRAMRNKSKSQKNTFLTSLPSSWA